MGVADTLTVRTDGQVNLDGTRSLIHIGAGAMTAGNDFSANRVIVAAD